MAVERRRKKAVLILKLILTGILLSLCGVIFFSLRSSEQNLTETIGPASEDLDWLAQLRYSVKLAGKIEELTKPQSGADEPAMVSISDGEAVAEIAVKLSESGIITNQELFLDYLVYSGIDKKILPGKYAFPAGLSLIEIGTRLSDVNSSLLSFNLYPGMRLEEIAQLIDGSGLTFSSEEFLSAAKNFPAADHPAAETSLEGYFLSGNYEINRSISLDAFLAGFVNHFERSITQDLSFAFESNGLTMEQAVIMASMIAREAMSPEEYGTIASVFYNRLQAGMKLESDPTAQYAIGWDEESKSWWKTPLNGSDLAIYSEYNTYIVPGFPIGPICSPSIGILQAVAYPEQTPYYYFRARCDGSPYHNFAVTYEEHIRNGCQ
ncbi:MAG: endolytic transglycosylase MltG [Flexilinea sp.]